MKNFFLHPKSLKKKSDPELNGIFVTTSKKGADMKTDEKHLLKAGPRL